MPPWPDLVFITAVFLLAGWVKGVVGMGLPTVAMGALGLVMAPVQAAAFLVVPSLVTNVWQFVAGPSRQVVLRRFASMMLLVVLGTALGIGFLTSGSRWPSLALGAVLAVYAAMALFMPSISVPRTTERRLSPLVGGITGVLGGATGVFVVPAVPYFSALAMDRDELIQALGLSFTVSTVALALALGAAGSYSLTQVAVSAVAVLPALLGMFVGQRTRKRIDPPTFRRWFFAAMLLVGLYMVARSLTSLMML